MEQRPEILKLGKLLREARLAKGLSARGLADLAEVHHRTVANFEQAVYEQPKADKLVRLAEVLELDPTDLLTLAGYEPTGKLPAFPVYLRATTALPEQAIDELHGHLEYLRNKYGVSAAGPTNGEDEADEPQGTHITK